MSCAPNLFPGQITAPNNVELVAGLANGSYIKIPLFDGTNTVSVCLTANANWNAGGIHGYVTIDGITLIQIPDDEFINIKDGAYDFNTQGANGAWNTYGVAGAAFYLVSDSAYSGLIMATVAAGPGSSNGSGSSGIASGITYYSNLGSGSAEQVATGVRKVKRVLGANGTGTAYWLQVFDLATAPVTGATPKLCFMVGIGVANSYTENERGPKQLDYFPFTNGIYVAWSSTQLTYTPVAPAEQYFEVDYA